MLSFVLTCVMSTAAQSPETVLVLELKGAGLEDDQLQVINDLVGQSVARVDAAKVITAPWSALAATSAVSRFKVSPSSTVSSP